MHRSSVGEKTQSCLRRDIPVTSHPFLGFSHATLDKSGNSGCRFPSFRFYLQVFP